MLERRESRVERKATFINDSKSKKYCPTLSTVPEEFEYEGTESVDTHTDPDFQLSEHSRFLPRRSTPNKWQAVATALEDKNLVTPLDKSLVIDKHKARRDRSKIRKLTQKQSSKTSPILGLNFDGKTDSTRVNEKKGHTYHQVTTAEELISLVEEPGGEHLGHHTSGKSAQSSSASILEVVGCDGTVTNTGHIGGIVMLLEKELVAILLTQLLRNCLSDIKLPNKMGPHIAKNVFLGKLVQN
ncbi:hypothetical protein FOCC_FOCC013239 [Frankliniella occidentalis]|nr:hypothetical protein FOCC_FOCC013239 [Frankliniella occidentalis]